MATDTPVTEDLQMTAGAKLAIGGIRVVQYSHTTDTEAPDTTVDTATWELLFKSSLESTVTLLDASARVTVLDASEGWVQVELTAADTDTLPRTGVYTLKMNDLILMQGRFTVGGA